MKWLFLNLENDASGLNESRGYACEIVAWQFLNYLAERELIDYLLYELPTPESTLEELHDAERGSAPGKSVVNNGHLGPANEQTALLQDHDSPSQSQLRPPLRQSENPSSSDTYQIDTNIAEISSEEDPTTSFAGLNALEIAATAGAKKFLSQRVVQKIVNGIWDGEIVFWETLSVHSKKKAQAYNKR